MIGLYGLSGQPFGATPDPRFLYTSETHREALASLHYAVQSGRGFTSLIAPPGLGKTTLLFRLLEDLEGQASTAFVFQTQCKSRELLRFILSEFSIDRPNSDLVTMHQALNDHLIAQARAGMRCVIVLDEAQNLNESALESVRLLSDFETPKQKLLHIVLSGQPELANKLLRPGLRQLQQRIGSVCKLEPLTPKEVEQYVEHRLAMAGHSGPPLFTPAAMAIIKQFSRGVPRNINALCFAALSLGYALNKKQLDAQVLEEAASDLSFEPPRNDEFLPRTLNVEDLPKEPTPPEQREAPVSTQRSEEIPATHRDSISSVAPKAATNPQGGQHPVGAAPAERAAPQVPSRLQVEDPVVRMEREERSNRQVANDPMQNIDLADYALLSGTERRRVQYEAYRPHGFQEPEKTISGVEDEPDPELEVLKRHLGQTTRSTEAVPLKKSIKQVLAIAGFAAVLSALVLIFLLWTRTGTSLAFSSPADETATPPPASGVPEGKTKTPATSPASRARKKVMSAPAAQKPTVPPGAQASTPFNAAPSASTSDAIPPRSQAEHQSGLPLNDTIPGDSYQAPPPPSPSRSVESTEGQTDHSAELKGAESIVDMSQPGDRPLHLVSPVYPVVAKDLRIAGTVVLRASVDKQGRVVDVQKISGDSRLVNAAIAAVQQWVYEPMIVNGRRISTERQIQIDFKLPVDAGALTGDSK